MRGGNSSSLKDPIAFLDQKPSAENVIEEIALLYRVTPTYVTDEAHVLLLLKHMRLYIQYLNNQPEMALEALLKGYLLDEALFPENCTPYNFIKNITCHKSFKFRYNKSISAQTFAESLNALDEIAQADEMRMSRMRENIIWEEKRDPPNMYPPQRYIMIHRLCHIIQNLAITPNYAPYIQWDCRTVTHPTFKEYLLKKVNDLHRHSNNNEEKFLRHFRGLLWMIMAIVAFQQKTYSKGTFTQFTRGLYIAVKKYKTEEEEKKSELGIYIPGTMQDFYIDRIYLGVNVVLFHSAQEVYDHLSCITDDLYQDFDKTRKLAIEVSLIVNKNCIREHLKTHLIDLDDKVLAYLEKKIKSETKILDVYKHLKHVVRFLTLLTNPKFNSDLNNNLYVCCEQMGTSGIKTCLQSRLNNSGDNLELLHSYPTEMRQTALMYWLSIKNKSEQGALFSAIHGDPLCLIDWIEILKKKENCTPFYENYLHYLRQSESDFPVFCRLETELFPSLRNFKHATYEASDKKSKRFSTELERLRFCEAFPLDSFGNANFTSFSTLAISTSSVFWSIFADLIKRKSPSLQDVSIYRNTQEVIQHIRTLLQKYLYVIARKVVKSREAAVVELRQNDTVSDYQNLSFMECHGLIQNVLRMDFNTFIQNIELLFFILDCQKKFNYAFTKSLRLVLTERIENVIQRYDTLNQDEQQCLINAFGYQPTNISALNKAYISIQDADAFLRALLKQQDFGFGFKEYDAHHSFIQLAQWQFSYVVNYVRRAVYLDIDISTSIKSFLINCFPEKYSQQIVDSPECLMLLGKLFLYLKNENTLDRDRVHYEKFILMRNMRHSITGEHTFSRILEKLAQENPITFKDSFAWWFVRQPTSYSYHNWMSGKTKLATNIEEIIGREISQSSAKTADDGTSTEKLSAETYFCRNDPTFEAFQFFYPEESYYLFSKEECVYFLQNQKFERAMAEYWPSTSLAFVQKLQEMIIADEREDLQANEVVYLNYITPGRAQHLADIFEGLRKETMSELNNIPEGADRSIADYLIDKTLTIAKKDDVFLRHFKGLTEMALAMLIYVKDKNKAALVDALKNAVQTYKGTLSYSPDFWKKNTGTDKMTNTYIGHLVQSMGDTITLDDDNSPEKGMGIELRGTRNLH